MEQSDNDTLQRFIFDAFQVRGTIVRMAKSYHAVLERHPYPLGIQQLLGQTLAATTLLSATLKYPGDITLQTDGDGLLKLLVAQSDQDYNVRGLAQWEGEINSDSFAALIGQGYLAMTVTPKSGNRYQSIVTLDGVSLASSIEAYFEKSEQIATCIGLFADKDFAVGLLLQTLPTDHFSPTTDFWRRAVDVIQGLTLDEVIHSSNIGILSKLFPSEAIHLFEYKPVQFRCGCTIKRMERAIRLYGFDEIQKILLTEQTVNVTCEFCNHSYNFDKQAISRIFSVDDHKDPP